MQHRTQLVRLDRGQEAGRVRHRPYRDLRSRTTVTPGRDPRGRPDHRVGSPVRRKLDAAPAAQAVPDRRVHAARRVHRMLCNVVADNGAPAARCWRVLAVNMLRTSLVVSAPRGIRSRCGSRDTRRCDSYIPRVLGCSARRPASHRRSHSPVFHAGVPPRARGVCSRSRASSACRRVRCPRIRRRSRSPTGPAGTSKVRYQLPCPDRCSKAQSGPSASPSPRHGNHTSCTHCPSLHAS